MTLVQALDHGSHAFSPAGRPSHEQSSYHFDLSNSQLEGTFDFPIHGSCSRCHHLHINTAFQLPLDGRKHTRIQCERCRHPILGIGRSSTQTTLASVETNESIPPSQPAEAGPDSVSSQQPITISTLSPPLRVNTALNPSQLSTITEGTSPAQHSSAALISSSPEDPVSERSVSSQDQIGNSQGGKHQGHELGPRGAFRFRGLAPESTTLSSAYSSGEAKKRSLRAKISTHVRKTREFNIPRLGIKIEVNRTNKIQDSLGAAVEQQLRNRRSPGSRSSAVNTPRSINHGVGGPLASASQLPLAPAMDAFPSHRQPDRLVGRTATQQDKDERIRARRREATLKRKAEMIAKCECRSECRCRNDSDNSNAASYGPAGSDRDIQIADHIFQHILDGNSGSGGSQSSSSMPRPLVSLDGGRHSQFDEPDGNDASEVVLEGRRSLDDRLSQASTVYVRSNGSSVSLSSRRPSPLRRSNTAPGPSMPRSLHGYRPGIREALQNRYLPDHIHTSDPEAPNSSRYGDQDAERSST